MSFQFTDYLNEARRLTKDDSDITGYPKGYKDALVPALRDYCARNPRVVVLDVPGTGGDINTTSLTGFESGFSSIRSIEFPISSANESPRLLPENSWQFYRAPSGLFIRFRGIAVPAGENARFTFIVRHALDEDSNTVPDSDFVMLTKLIAAEACMQLSRHFTQSSERQILQADIALYVNKGKEYEQRALQLRKEALDPPSRFIFA